MAASDEGCVISAAVVVSFGSAKLQAMADLLTELDVDNLAGHCARQKARGAAYVMVPAT